MCLGFVCSFIHQVVSSMDLWVPANPEGEGLSQEARCRGACREQMSNTVPNLLAIALSTQAPQCLSMSSTPPPPSRIQHAQRCSGFSRGPSSHRFFGTVQSGPGPAKLCRGSQAQWGHSQLLPSWRQWPGQLPRNSPRSPQGSSVLGSQRNLGRLQSRISPHPAIGMDLPASVRSPFHYCSHSIPRLPAPSSIQPSTYSSKTEGRASGHLRT